MTECYQTSIPFSPVKRRKVEADFSSGDISSNGGVLLLAEVDKRLNLSATIAKTLADNRRQASCKHSLETLIKQRLYSLALGYEDLNDHIELRHDLALQTAASQQDFLASSATLCRLEQRTDRQTAIDLHRVLFEQFVKQHKKPPKLLIGV